MLAAGADVHATDVKGETPLHHAAAEDSACAVEMLLRAQANPNLYKRVGQTPSDLTSKGGKSRCLLDAVTHELGPEGLGP